ncbi:MAG: aspartate/glutamate racemase family protein [Gammaproteobacteria bacterium]|nr:aspartate/glutamate racemase family protein [Gammaproteobacteria bacterium]
MGSDNGQPQRRPRIGLVHALHASIAPIEAAFLENWPEAETVSLYDQSLYADFNKTRTLTPGIFQRIEGLLRFSQQSGAEAILFTGSLFGDPVEAARERIDIPVLTAYEAMIEEAFAVAERPRLGLLATAAGTAEMMSTDIREYAEKHGREYDLDARHIAGAIDALLWGDREEHDELVAAAVAQMADVDALMLGQFSMAPVVKRLPEVPGRPVLTSPGAAVSKLKRVLGW